MLKKLSNDKEKLECISINGPKKVLEGKLAGMYACQVCLPDKKLTSLIYGDNPIEAVCFASDFAKLYLREFINRGYSISEVESKEPWKLEKADISSIVRERINNLETMLNDDKSISPEVKQELLKDLRKLGGIETKK